ncbi:MAG: CRTAC1 family protein [Bryobacterales bacterium]|nr:CRTAC1 family protein [Bryobacterales bacterium]
MKIILLPFCLIALAGCGSRETPPAEPKTAGVKRAEAPRFRDATAEAGLNFQHFTGATGEFYFPEMVGPGVALFDYDGDGDLDVYLTQGNFLDPSKTMADAKFPMPAGWNPGNRLFRNELIPQGRLHFTDVTTQAGVGYVGYGMGVAVGDYDNDGRPDLYVTNFEHNVLYHNTGDGTFTDVTARAGVDDGMWSTSAAFVDYDRDGDLDLFVVHYVEFTRKGNPRCTGVVGQRDYCGPQVFQPLSARLYRNDGSGKFTDVTARAGLPTAFGAGLGVVCADFDGDGWPDVYVANDGNANQLWRNKKNGTFEDIALSSGVAFSADGKPQAGMGVSAGDFDNDGDEDLFVTNLTTETNNLFVNDGKGIFRDAIMEYGMAASSLRMTGFGAEFFDFDNDGFLDLFVANGAVFAPASLRGRPYPYDQKNQLFRNLMGKKFEDLTESSGPVFQLSEVGRGAAFGDMDNDGDIDIVVSNNNGPTRLVLNEIGSRLPSLSVELKGVKNNRMGIGARVGLVRQGRPIVWRRAHTDGSYLTANDIRVHFGLGAEPPVDSLAVIWPNGRSEVWKRLEGTTRILLREGTGSPFQEKR